MLKPSAAVETTTPGIWGCQCNSLHSRCPMCTKSNCGGTSCNSNKCCQLRWQKIGGDDLVEFHLYHLSPKIDPTKTTDHHLNCIGQPKVKCNGSILDTATTDSSDGCHSTEVIGFWCHLKWAAGWSLPVLLNLAEQWIYALKLRKSQILKDPSSEPETSKYETFLFHEITLTSSEWASIPYWSTPLQKK